MKINYQQLKDLAVVTESGDSLGHVVGLEIDVQSFQITKLDVADKTLFLTSGNYLIGPDQIIQITKEQIIVQNNVATVKASQKQNQNLKTENMATLSAERQD
jgi:uncharacterized protein YrrD